MCYYYKVNKDESIESPRRYEVGFYDPKGDWHLEQVYDDVDEAAARVNYLNGGTGELRR